MTTSNQSALEIPVVCHDFRSVLTGMLREISDTGCELVSGMETEGPVFPQKTQVFLNLVDERSGRSVNIRARLTAVVRRGGQWVYRIRWSRVPEFAMTL
jgi:hypothetical protein